MKRGMYRLTLHNIQYKLNLKKISYKPSFLKTSWFHVRHIRKLGALVLLEFLKALICKLPGTKKNPAVNPQLLAQGEGNLCRYLVRLLDTRTDSGLYETKQPSEVDAIDQVLDR